MTDKQAQDILDAFDAEGKAGNRGVSSLTVVALSLGVQQRCINDSAGVRVDDLGMCTPTPAAFAAG